jgi:hypothetical protein
LFSEPERRGGWSASTGAGLAGFEVTPTGRIGASPEAAAIFIGLQLPMLFLAHVFNH